MVDRARIDRVRGDTNTRCSASSADRDKDHIKLRFVFKHLERLSRNARDQQRLVSRMNVTIVMPGGEHLAVQPRFIET